MASSSLYIRYVRCLWMATCLTALSPSVLAQAPRTLSVSGVLAGPSGTPKPNGSYILTFRLFDVPTGGSALWTEANRPVTVAGGKGAFTTQLGSATPLSLPFNKPYYLEVQAQGEASPMTPRLALASSPYSLSSTGTATLTLPYAGSANVASPGVALKVTNTGTGLGILGEAPAHVGVQGISDTWVGVWGQSNKSTGVHGQSDIWNGVAGISNSGAGVWGQSQTNTGVFGKSELWEGVHGESAKDKGVYGGSVNWVGVWGHSNTSTGVYGVSDSGRGVHGQSKGGPGVFGESLKDASGFSGHGVHGVSHYLNQGGVYGENDFRGGGVGVIGVGIGGYTTGVRGTSGTGAVGELGTYDNTDGRGIGVRASAPPSGGTGLYASANPGSVAGLFSGQVVVNGRLDVYGAKNFRIDHPLDPANKTLTHSWVEGPEALNLYKGRVTTDANGEAVVHLPGYFEALNRDFEYHLTCIGQFAQVIVAEEIHDNRFTIQTDKPNVKVSWQVTGVRNDAYMRTHPHPVEEFKPADQRGKYLDPESHGQPKEKGVHYLPVERLNPPAR